MDREADERRHLVRRGEAARGVAVPEPRHPLAVHEHRVLLTFDADLELVPQAWRPRRDRRALLLRLAVDRARAPDDRAVGCAGLVNADFEAEVHRHVRRVLVAAALGIREAQEHARAALLAASLPPL